VRLFNCYEIRKGKIYVLDSKNVLSVFFEVDLQFNSIALKSEILQSFLYC